VWTQKRFDNLPM